MAGTVAGRIHGQGRQGTDPGGSRSAGGAEVYGNDRVFAYIRLENGADPAQDKAVEALAKAGHPVVRIALSDIYNLGQEMFRWEIATAVAGSVIGINAFNQPDVEASKMETRKLTSEYEKTGSLPPESPVLSESGIDLFTDAANAAALASAAGSDKTLVGYLRAHLNRLKAGDYFALLGYVEMNQPHEKTLQSHADRRARQEDTWPRAWDSGRASCTRPVKRTRAGRTAACSCRSPATTRPISRCPGQKFTFGVVKAAQARGDFQVLADRKRRALRVHLHDVESGLAASASGDRKSVILDSRR